MDDKEKKELEETASRPEAEETAEKAEGQARGTDEPAVQPGQEGADKTAGGAVELTKAEYDPALDAQHTAQDAGEHGGRDVPEMEAEDLADQGTPAQTTNGGKVWPIISLVLAVLLIVVLIKPPFAAKKAEAVATVNGVEITKDQLYNELVTQGGEQVLSGLIDQELINQEAKKKNITITDADIDAEIKDTYVAQFGSQEALDQALVQYGMTKDDLRSQIASQLKLTKLLEPQVKVTDDQIKQTFETYKDSFNTPEQVRASIILVKTEDEAKDIIKQLKGGADFAELAKSKSLDTATKEQGGDTDFFARGQKETAVEDAAFKLTKGQISDPVKTSEGYQVIKLTDRKEAHTATLDEKKEEIRKTLVNQQVSQLSATWLQNLHSSSKITNTLTDANNAAAAK
ncbi:peptidyl-prolyl cis-trans isomerase [Paenibacillus macerans]|uniref:peptidylprolyl isomerase n=1 Tax=Paenibacillus macerans TaxID=44252 RepID=UPI00203E5FA2|nr:peptidyl-prolyl cis-trans isomerase [Paenibacillus macerans]MCM3700431.1 peptidyl-prolyl cis-trans isomerase [Paenibacillus macerans]